MNINTDRELHTSTPEETADRLPESQGSRVETAGNFGADASLCETPVRALPETGRRSDGRPVGRPFQRGQTGNPRGRPKGLRGAVQRLIGVDGGKALRALYATATNPTNGERVRIQAWELLLAYGFGKPQTSVSLEGNEMRPLIIDQVTQADVTVRTVQFGGRYKPDGDLQADRVETRPIHRSVDRGTPRDDERDDDSDILTAAAQSPAGALPAPTVAVPEPEPDDPAESAWTAVEP